jgi:hypothetical protein
MQVPLARQLDDAQRDSIKRLAHLVYRHLPAAQAMAATDALVEQYSGGESLFASLRSAPAGGAEQVYLYVDLGDVEDAMHQASVIAGSHGLSACVAWDDPSSPPMALWSYDTWLTAQGLRFVQHRAVDWGYAGLVLPADDLPAFLEYCDELGESFLAGCED